MISIYRNLNLAKKNKHVFHWSICDTPISKSGKVSMSRGKLREHTQSIVISNPVAVCKTSRLQHIANGANREVAAWFVGKELHPSQIPQGTKRQITINPLPNAKGGRSELAFVWSDTKEIITEKLLAIEFSSKGAFAII
jgi:hypothetical protein